MDEIQFVILGWCFSGETRASDSFQRKASIELENVFDKAAYSVAMWSLRNTMGKE